jgi:molecular chaperone DnaK (HSP70)
MSVFGVDFGTLNSTVALTRNGGVDVILNEVSKRETFTFVSLGNEERYLGESGADKAVRNAANTVSCIKRFIGMRADDPEVASEKRFFFGTTSADAEGRLMFDVNYNDELKSFYPEQILAMFLAQLSKYVDREAVIDGAPAGTHVKDCVLTVPCYYTAEQRKLTIQAAEIAGLNCMALVNETSAAGIDYGIFRGSSLPETEADAVTVAITDLGYSATTVTIAQFWKSNMKVLTHVCDKNVGTRELDYYLTQHFAKEIQKKYKVDVTENKRARVRVLQTCEKVKTLLSGNLTAPLNIENLMDVDVNIAGFTREEMEVACAEVFDRLRALIKDAVKSAGLENNQIAKVEVIGGGSRIPMYKKVVEESFEQVPQFTLNATESVARGCAITAAVYSPKFKVREFVVHESPARSILLGYRSDTSSTAVSKVDFLGDDKVNKVITILSKTDRYPKTLELTFDRTDEFDLYYFYDEEKSADLKEKKQQPLLLPGQTKTSTSFILFLLFYIFWKADRFRRSWDKHSFFRQFPSFKNKSATQNVRDCTAEARPAAEKSGPPGPSVGAAAGPTEARAAAAAT